MTAKVQLKGLAASPSIGIGLVRIVDGETPVTSVEEGEVLVAKKTDPEFVIAMKKCAAIVTDAGGLLSHAAIVARAFGVPCVVGTRRATKLLQTGQLVKVDGTKGTVETLE